MPEHMAQYRFREDTYHDENGFYWAHAGNFDLRGPVISWDDLPEQVQRAMCAGSIIQPDRNISPPLLTLHNCEVQVWPDGDVAVKPLSREITMKPVGGEQ